MLTPFHIAIQVRNIVEARNFYGKKMGLSEGRSSDEWIDFNMFGHQFVTHLNPSLGKNGKVVSSYNSVDSHEVPVPHCGVLLEFNQWQQFAEKLKIFIPEFIIEPSIRFKGKVGEQGTLFFFDPSGNALEFKTFKDINSQLFAKC